MMSVLADLHPYARFEEPDRPARTVIEGRRGKPEMLWVRATEVADLNDELTALHAERASAAEQLFAIAKAVEFAVRGERPDVAMHCAGRLFALAMSLARRGAA